MGQIIRSFTAERGAEVDGGAEGARVGRQLTDSVEVLYVHATIKLKVVQRVSRETGAVRGEEGTACF